MKAINVYEPVDLSVDEKKVLEMQMAKAFEAFQRASLERYGFANVRKLRDDYKSQSTSTRNMLWSDPDARKHMDWMIANEKRIISGYIRVANDLCLAFELANEKSGPNYSDYLQEAAMAIYDAMYQYNGSNQFCTYAYWTVKNRLISFRRSELARKGLTRKILQLKSQVKELLSDNGLTFDQAICQLQASGVDIKPQILARLKIAFNMNTESSMFEVVSPVVDEEFQETIENMRQAVNDANLTEMERNLVEAHLRGDENYRKLISETVINPSTGRLWTKQRLSQIFVSACEKIRAVYQIQQTRQAV